MTSKKVLAAICLIVMQLSIKAQIQLSYSNRAFYLTTPAAKSQVIDGVGSKAKVFLETGDGGFMQFVTTDFHQQNFTRPWYFHSNSSFQSVVQLNMIYDTIRRPPHAAAVRFSPAADNDHSNPVQSVLAAFDQFIKITPSVTTIVPGDTMTLAITYKGRPQKGGSSPLCSYTKSVIAFYYNAPGVDDLFSPIDDNTQYNFSGTLVKAIRKATNANVIPLTNLPAAIQDLVRPTPGYSKVIYITVPYINDGVERNIFFSLAPNADSTKYNLLTSSVKTAIVDYDASSPSCNSGLNVSEIYTQDFDIDFTSGDPNSIITEPACFKSPGDVNDKKIKYKVHFENMGAGNANKILVEVAIPKGIGLPLLIPGIFKCKIGNTFIPVQNEGPFFQQDKKDNTRKCLYRIDINKRKIYFTIQNAGLKGSIETNGIDDKGDIQFELGTGHHQVQQIPMCMRSGVTIKFDDNPPLSDFSLIMVGCYSRKSCPPEVYNPHTGD